MKDIVKFSNISWPLKIAVVMGWFALILFTFGFLRGLIEGLFGV